MTSLHDARIDTADGKSIDATQRKLIIGIVIAALLTLAAVIADLAIGAPHDGEAG